MRNHPYFALLFVALLSGCASDSVRQATPPPETAPQSAVAAASTASTPLAVAVEQPRNLAADNLNAVAWTQTSVEHDAIFTEVYRNAQQQLLAALKDPAWDALVPFERHNDVRGLKPAIILDVDETVLDNSPYQARLIRSGTSYNEATWADWVREASAQALPGAVAFTRFAAQHGVAVFYISNREQSLDQATLRNLREQGFPVSGPGVFLGLGAPVEGCVHKGSDKTCRRQLVARNYRILMQFGDQIGDFMPITDNSLQARRAAAQAHMDWFGQRWFMLPNPTYGSWQPALFGNDWSLSPARRHTETVRALRVE